MSDAPNTVAELSARDPRGYALRVRFFWRGDRYGHVIEAINGLQVTPLLESLEDDHDCSWPASPPLQHVNVSWVVSDSNHGHVALLVGAAGKNHWSMCVEARDRTPEPRKDQAAATELIFDVACRAGQPPQWLGNSYRALAGSITVSENLNYAFIPGDAPGCVVVPQGVRLESRTSSAELPILQCTATETDFIESPVTVRWCYSVRRSSGGPLHSQEITHWRKAGVARRT